ncbi:MAG: F0F1 ATP synthase subunit gamma [Gammaproteobacteria bacterium]|nr:MAG: F0F1 ATP synthase subunit gamma [Gammaproteobacteria bacterium]
MANEKEIRSQIASIKNTQKITKAMEMVAASKMRKAKDRMNATRPYASKMRNVIGHLANANTEYNHPFLLDREEVKRVGYIIISSDRGLCGGLNVNLFKAALNDMQQWQDKNVEIDFCLIGAKATQFFKKFSANIVSQVSQLGDEVHLEELIGTVKAMLDAYTDGKIDRLYLVENEFVNSMTQEPKVSPLLPLAAEDNDEMKHHWDYIYEPDAKTVLDGLLTRYAESIVYQGVVENVACEMSARMVAMKSASDNAGDLISDLELAYNKARQAAITQEISEICGGAAAV